MGAKLKNYLPVNRQFFQHPFWEEKRTFSKAEAWLDLVRSARFEDSMARELIAGKMISWTRGQYPVSLRFLADRWGWDKNKADRFLKLLVKEKMIAIGTVNGTSQTIVTICNYETYNAVGDKVGQQTGQGRDSDGTPAGQGRDKYNKENKEEEREEEAAATSDTPLLAPRQERQEWLATQLVMLTGGAMDAATAKGEADKMLKKAPAPMQNYILTWATKWLASQNHQLREGAQQSTNGSTVSTILEERRKREERARARQDG